MIESKTIIFAGRDSSFSFFCFHQKTQLLLRSGLRGERQQSAGPCDVSAADLRHAGRDGASVAALPVPPAAQHASGWRRLQLGGQQLSSRQQHGLLRPGPEWVAHIEQKHHDDGGDGVDGVDDDEKGEMRMAFSKSKSTDSTLLLT